MLIRPDGSEGDTVPLSDGTTTIGRESGGVFASDAYLSPKHAVFSITGSDIKVTDEDSLNGVYFRAEKDVANELLPGDVFRVGQEILRYELIAPTKPESDGVERMGSPNTDVVGRLSLVIGRETTAGAHPITTRGIHIGRERGEIIFPEDGYVSGLHCRVHVEGGKVFLTDVGSSNGTFVRVRGEKTVKPGTLLLMGQQLFRVQQAS